MNINNVAMIMAPNLFLVQQSRKSQAQKRDLEISKAAGTSSIVKMLIKYQDILWSVPSFMVAQMRHQYEANQMRSSSNKSVSQGFNVALSSCSRSLRVCADYEVSWKEG